MASKKSLETQLKKIALASGADLVGIGSIDRFDRAPEEVHPRSIFSKTQSVIALGCRQLRGSLKTIEEGNYWQAYNCSSYQYLSEILAPHMLRKIILFLEDLGYTSVPLHNPFAPHLGRPVRPGGTRPDGAISLRVIGCAAGLGELGLSKVFLTPQFGPRQRVFGILTDAVLEPDPLFTGSICDSCGECAGACPAGAISTDRSVEVRIGDRTFSHGELNCRECSRVHQGWDPRYSPFVDRDSSKQNPPPYYRFLERRFRALAIFAARGCIRKCMDHLEKAGRIEKQYRTPMVEGEQWVINEPLE